VRTEAQKAAHRAAMKRYWERNAHKRMDWAKANPDRARQIQRKFHGQPEPTRLCPATCEICGAPPTTGRWKKLHEDHDHTTGKFRGWLCHGCNISLGYFKDDPKLLLRAAAYLEST